MLANSVLMQSLRTNLAPRLLHAHRHAHPLASRNALASTTSIGLRAHRTIMASASSASQRPNMASTSSSSPDPAGAPTLVAAPSISTTAPAAPAAPVTGAGPEPQAAIANTDQTMTLPDSRTLGYAEYGAVDGAPLLYFHGFPSSRREVHGLERMIAEAGLRMIVPDRPGFGLSSPQPGRRITDWPQDVEALAAHLGFQRYAVLGGSGGGPYALVCGARIPADKLTAVGVMAGAPPWEAGPNQPLPEDISVAKTTETYRRVLAVQAAWAPWSLRWLMNGLVAFARWGFETQYARRYTEEWLKNKDPNLEEERRSGLTIPERRTRLMAAVFEPFKQGAGAMVHESYLLSRDWGFRFEEVEYQPVKMWHGTKDVNAPIQLMRYMAQRIPHAELEEYDVDHYDILPMMKDVFGALLPENSKMEHEGNVSALKGTTTEQGDKM